MRRSLALMCTLCFLGVSGSAGTAARQVKPAAATTATVDDVLRAVRDDLQSARADLMAKNLSLTAEQAAKFWPVFDAYQKEQNAVMDEQMKSIQTYVDGYDRLDDAGALALMKAHLDRDAKMTALRVKWLGDFQKVLPARLAVRAMQIDRRLSLAQQMEFASRIPLVH